VDGKTIEVYVTKDSRFAAKLQLYTPPDSYTVSLRIVAKVFFNATQYGGSLKVTAFPEKHTLQAGMVNMCELFE
jgi:hypothetical protein